MIFSGFHNHLLYANDAHKTHSHTKNTIFNDCVLYKTYLYNNLKTIFFFFNLKTFFSFPLFYYQTDCFVPVKLTVLAVNHTSRNL